MANKGAKGLEITGFKELYKKMGLLEEEIKKGALKGLKITAQNILGESQKLVPVDTGTLQKSGTIKLNSETLTAQISYNTPYALKQHEDATLNHPNGGEAKYLERPFNEKAGELEVNIGNEINRILRKKNA